MVFFPSIANKIFSYLICAYALTKKLKKFGKIKIKKIKNEGNIKFIDKVKIEENKNDNDEFLSKSHFGLQQVFIKKRIYFV